MDPWDQAPSVRISAPMRRPSEDSHCRTDIGQRLGQDDMAGRGQQVSSLRPPEPVQ